MIDDVWYSRLFNVHAWSEHKAVMDLTDHVFQSLTADQQAAVIGKSNNKGTTDLYRVLRVILVDQYVSWKMDPKLCTALSRGRNQWIVGSRYNGLHLPHRTLEVIDMLVGQGYLDKANHSYSGTGSSTDNRTTRIKPTDVLAELFAKVGLELEDLELHKDQETIILRASGDADDSKAKDVEYEDTPLTNKMREEVQAYNAMMQRHYVDVASQHEPFICRDIKLPGSKGSTQQRIGINASNMFCRRIFSRNSFELNGRWHGGFWQNIPKDMRRDIYIDDAITEEVDYSGLHPTILAHEQGHKLSGDRYDIGKLIIPNMTEDAQRNAVKLLVLMAINAKDPVEAFRAYNAKAPKTLKHVQLKALLEAFLHKHPFLETSLCADQGIRLMHLDSLITTEIINTFVSANTPILPIHDSYIVKKADIPKLQNAMSEASLKVLGLDLDRETKHEGMLGKVTKAAKRTDGSITDDNFIIMKYDLADKTKGYKERYKLWKSKHL